MFNLRLFNNVTSKYSPTIINKIRSISIFKRLIFSFFSVIIIPSLIIGFVTFEKYSTELEATASEYLYYTIENVNGNIDDKLRKYEELSYKIYRDESIIDILQKSIVAEKVKEYVPEEYEKYKKYKENLNTKLYYATEYYDFIDNIEIITDVDQYTQLNYNGERRGAKVKDLNRFRESSNYTTALQANGYPVWFDTSGETGVYERPLALTDSIYHYVTLMRAILDPETATPLGVIVININVKAFSELYHSQGLIDKGNLLLIGKKDVMCSLNENIYAPILNQELLLEISRLRNGILIRDIEGESCLVVFRASSYTGWIMANIVERDKLIWSVYEIRNIIMRVSIICILFALIISYLVTVSISIPLNKIKKAMGGIDENTIEVCYVDEVDDEIGILGQKFNSMMTRIKNLMDRIYEVEVAKKDLEIRRKNAELNALQMQINPHFLYNTLDIIRWEAMFQESGEGKISGMISDFSKLLRLGTKKSKNLVAIKEEVDHVSAYIKVTNHRYKDSIEINCEIDEDILEFKITKLTLQPLVENTVFHGFPKVKKERQLTIKGAKKGNDIIIQVMDNGNGISPEKLEEINKSLQSKDYEADSIGLKNVHERIQLYFGDAYGITIESQLNHGTTVNIRIPCIQNETLEIKGESNV